MLVESGRTSLGRSCSVCQLPLWLPFFADSGGEVIEVDAQLSHSLSAIGQLMLLSTVETQCFLLECEQHDYIIVMLNRGRTL